MHSASHFPRMLGHRRINASETLIQRMALCRQARRLR